MTPSPLPLVCACDRVIVDKDTNSPSAIASLPAWRSKHFPSDSQRFLRTFSLTDAQGDGRGKLAVYA